MATLKISDLSVGDWVRYGNENKQIKCIDLQNNNYFVHFSDPDTNDNDYAHIFDIEPIPITAEILEKNGWAQTRSQGYKCKCGNYDIHIWLNASHTTVTIYEQGVILAAIRAQLAIPEMSIGQLQHALRLAGVDKEIIL